MDRISPEQELAIEEARHRALATALTQLISTEILDDEEADVVTDRTGRVTQRGLDIPDIFGPDSNSRRSIDLYNERSSEEPMIEVVTVWRDDTTDLTSFWVAAEMRIYQDGRLREVPGVTTGLNEDIQWIETPVMPEEKTAGGLRDCNDSASHVLKSLTAYVLAKHDL